MIRLERQTRPLPIVSIIPLVDVLLILLVFFMVTSTFLDLDMLPMSAPEAEGTPSSDASSETVLLRILPDGAVSTSGRLIAPEGLEAFLAAQAEARILLLPSPQADVQALVGVLDTAARLGLTSISVLQLGAGN